MLIPRILPILRHLPEFVSLREVHMLAQVNHRVVNERSNLRLLILENESVLFLRSILDINVERALQGQFAEFLQNSDLHFLIVRINESQLYQLANSGALGRVAFWREGVPIDDDVY